MFSSAISGAAMTVRQRSWNGWKNDEKLTFTLPPKEGEGK